MRKADGFFEMFALDALRVASSAGKADAALFASLEEWFGGYRRLLAKPVAAEAYGAVHRVFLEPKQSLRLGLAHATFAIEWLRVAEADDPLSGSILAQMGMAGRRPKRMLLVVLYRAEANAITHMWADIDREGLGNKRAVTLDDVLVSDVFERCLNIARKHGATGELNPRLQEVDE